MITPKERQQLHNLARSLDVRPDPTDAFNPYLTRPPLLVTTRYQVPTSMRGRTGQTS